MKRDGWSLPADHGSRSTSLVAPQPSAGMLHAQLKLPGETVR